MSGCILVMCGLPASGKTTLVSQFVTSVADQVSCLLVSYDKLMPPEVEQNLIGQSCENQDVKLWKKYRENIVNCTDRLLHSVTTSDQKGSASEGSLTKDGHSESTEQLLAAQGDTASCDHVWEKFIQCVGNQSVSDRETVVIIDDNMYYRSMRYDYYQLARKYCFGFCEVFVECPSATAIYRNKKRTVGKVSDDVIVAMETKLEIPKASSYHWEKYSLVLSSDVELCISKMQQLVKLATLDPVKAPIDDTEERVESRRVSSANVFHQVDQITRKLLAQSMKAAREGGKSKEEMTNLSAKLSDVKANIIGDIRTGVITCDVIDVDNPAKDENSELFKFVKNLFDERSADIR